MKRIPTTVWVSRTNVFHFGPLQAPTTTWKQLECPSHQVIFCLSCTAKEVLAEGQATGGTWWRVITKSLTKADFYEKKLKNEHSRDVASI
jgi:hypothetical protein